MQHKNSALLVFLILSAQFYFQTVAFALRVDKATYPYPYENPYLATTIFSILQGSETPASSEIIDLRLKVLGNRNDIYLLEGMGKLRYRFYQQNGSAPLVFIIPGLAGTAYSGAATFLAEWFADNGFHALILPSPRSWNFALSASTSGYPGNTREDAKDLYAVMQIVLNDIKNRSHAQISQIGVLGYSDGALYAGYLSKEDSEKRKIGIDTYLLINPPLELLETAKKIDRMADIGKSFGTQYKADIEAYAFGVVADALNQDVSTPDYFANWDKRFLLRGRQIEYLIGKILNDAVGDTFYVIELVNHPRILTTPISWGHRSDRLEEARSYGLSRYVEDFLIPRLQHSGNSTKTSKRLDNSLREVKPVIEKNPAIFLMHNLDDILISPEDIDYMEKIFGDRAIIYPYGGHLGNLWYPENKKHMLQVFKPLLQNNVSLSH